MHSHRPLVAGWCCHDLSPTPHSNSWVLMMWRKQHQIHSCDRTDDVAAVQTTSYRRLLVPRDISSPTVTRTAISQTLNTKCFVSKLVKQYEHFLCLPLHHIFTVLTANIYIIYIFNTNVLCLYVFNSVYGCYLVYSINKYLQTLI